MLIIALSPLYVSAVPGGRKHCPKIPRRLGKLRDEKRKSWNVLFLLGRELDVETVFLGVPVCNSLDGGDLGFLQFRLEKVAEPLLGL